MNQDMLDALRYSMSYGVSYPFHFQSIAKMLIEQEMESIEQEYYLLLINQRRNIMSFTLPSYKDCLKKGKQMIEEALIPIRVSKTKAQAEIEQLKLQEEVLNLEVKIQEMEIKDPVPFEDMIAAMNKIELLQRKEFLLNKIISEMFPVEEKVKK